MIPVTIDVKFLASEEMYVVRSWRFFYKGPDSFICLLFIPLGTIKLFMNKASKSDDFGLFKD